MEEEKNKKKAIVVKEFLVYCIFKREVHITDIMTEIRAIKGVITVSVFEPEAKISEEKMLAKLRLKYLQFSDVIDEDVKELKKNILFINGVNNIILKIKKVDLDGLYNTEMR
jgi:phosphoribosylanthranilate isomerase